jgi:LysM repeat protein
MAGSPDTSNVAVTDELSDVSAAIQTHTVVEGETLQGISLKHRVKLGDLARWNSVHPTEHIHFGQVLNIVPPKLFDEPTWMSFDENPADSASNPASVPAGEPASKRTSEPIGLREPAVEPAVEPSSEYVKRSALSTMSGFMASAASASKAAASSTLAASKAAASSTLAASKAVANTTVVASKAVASSTVVASKAAASSTVAAGTMLAKGTASIGKWVGSKEVHEAIEIVPEVPGMGANRGELATITEEPGDCTEGRESDVEPFFISNAPDDNTHSRSHDKKKWPSLLFSSKVAFVFF